MSLIVRYCLAMMFQVRYALPILILLILCAATFWADAETRIDTTMTILLSVSALYVVIIDGKLLKNSNFFCHCVILCASRFNYSF